MAELIQLPTFKDERGCLTVLEKILPFEIKRVYWLYNVKDNSRGGHRHFNTAQAFICLHGQVNVTVKRHQQEHCFQLKNSEQCLLMPPEDWHTLENFSDHAVVLVLASHEYDAKDYSTEPL